MKTNSRRWQEIVLVLEALRELGGFNTKQEVIGYILSQKWFNPDFMDREQYAGTREPKYITLLAWGRKVGALKGLIFCGERDSWGITRQGVVTLEKIHKAYELGELFIHECFLFTPKFKQRMVPSFTPSEIDWQKSDDFSKELNRILV